MRTYGRANGVWQEITETSYIWLATLIQVLRLQKGESPIYGNYGISAKQSVLTQMAPDADVATVQQQFSQYFASLTIQRVPNTLNPTYNVSVVFLNGTSIQTTVAS